jgi:hypothetical protein
MRVCVCVYIHEVSFAHLYVCMCVYMYIHVCMCEQVGNTVVKTITKPNGHVVTKVVHKKGRKPAKAVCAYDDGTSSTHIHTHTHTLREVVLL